MLTCKETSLLVSQSLDRRLSWPERWRATAHLIICSACRRFRRQARFMRKAAHRYVMATLRPAPPLDLSNEARDRIRQALVRET